MKKGAYAHISAFPITETDTINAQLGVSNSFVAGRLWSGYRARRMGQAALVAKAFHQWLP
jgi:hypothetical protein